MENGTFMELNAEFVESIGALAVKSLEELKELSTQGGVIDKKKFTAATTALGLALCEVGVRVLAEAGASRTSLIEMMSSLIAEKT